MVALLPFTFAIQSCNGVDPIEIIENILTVLDQTGWLQDKENMNDIPDDITPFDDEDGGAMAGTVSLENKFPPIGDQGQYGTCVAWAVGYNLKTSLNAIEKGWTSTDLANTANQTSPKDLWFAIPRDKVGENCGGTNFEPAMDALISTGVGSLSSVPYSGMGNCTGTAKGDGGNKLANYRKIASETEGLTPENFKGYLNAGRPIAIGAKLGDNFMTWKTNSVISSDTYNNPGMMHAYHAMALVGYDDSKNAFRVRNSWGTTWGDNGSIWVDYDFFCSGNFCFAAFVAQNQAVASATPPRLDGFDMLPLSAVDYAYTPNPDEPQNHNRAVEYGVYNSGTRNITPSQKWRVYYMYYNAKKASDYKIIYEDYYTDEYGTEGDFDELDKSNALVGGYWNNVTLNVGETINDENYVTYEMPKITGSYYLVVKVDVFDVIKEENEDNNFFFISAENGKPLEFENGVIKNMPSKSEQLKGKELRPELFANTENQTLVKPGNLNAYTPQEIQTMLLHDKKTGKLDAKLKAFRESNPEMKGVKKVKK